MAETQLKELDGEERLARSSRASRASCCRSVVGDSTKAVAPQGAHHADLLGHAHPAKELEVARLKLAGFPIRSVQADGWNEPYPRKRGVKKKRRKTANWQEARKLQKVTSPNK